MAHFYTWFWLDEKSRCIKHRRSDLLEKQHWPKTKEFLELLFLDFLFGLSIIISHHHDTPIFKSLSFYFFIFNVHFFILSLSITLSIYLSIYLSLSVSVNQYSIAADPGANIDLAQSKGGKQKIFIQIPYNFIGNNSILYSQ